MKGIDCKYSILFASFSYLRQLLCHNRNTILKPDEFQPSQSHTGSIPKQHQMSTNPVFKITRKVQKLFSKEKPQSFNKEIEVFTDAFRIIAANPVGRMLLYRILREIGRTSGLEVGLRPPLDDEVNDYWTQLRAGKSV
jgi:hypothetical protein